MRISYTILAVVSGLFIIYMSSLPDQAYFGINRKTEQVVSNLAHIPVFALLSFLWFKAFPTAKIKIDMLSPGLMIFMGLVLFAGLDEIHQYYVPGRTASFMDFGLDLMGIGIGFGLSCNIRFT